MATIYDLDTPSLLVDLTRLEANIARFADLSRTSGKALRPHAKTHKSPDIAHMQLKQGAIGLTVAKLGEAEVFADAGITDLFVANEIYGEAKTGRLLRLLERAEVKVGVDSVAVAEPLAEAARARGLRLPVMLECDTGMHRAGARTLDEALTLARFVAEHPGLELRGVFTHEGHLYGLKDPVERKTTAAGVARQLREIVAAFVQSGFRAEVVSVGSTPGAPLMAGEEGISELRPGNYVFYDRVQARLGAQAEDCALSVLATIIGVHSDGRVIIDAGMKSLAGDCPFEDRTWGEVIGKPDWTFVSISEEHGMIQLTQEATRPKVGEKVRIVPNHACTCANMHEEMIAFRGDEVVETWPIAARGKIK